MEITLSMTVWDVVSVNKVIEMEEYGQLVFLPLRRIIHFIVVFFSFKKKY